MSSLFETIKNRRVGSTFIPYITAGDPNLEATKIFVKALARAGADIIELGVPFSDPVADGPTNQRAAERALSNGTTLEGIFALVKELRADGERVPILLFTYFNPLFRLGLENVAEKAKKCGVDGILVVDLPPEEAELYLRIMGKAGIETVFLASPTTEVSRLKTIGSASSGFVYYVSRTGVTGTQTSPSKALEAQIKDIRRCIDNPIAVGFGISTVEQAKKIATIAEGVVVGSFLVNLIEQSSEPSEAEKRLFEAAKAFADAIHRSEKC